MIFLTEEQQAEYHVQQMGEDEAVYRNYGHRFIESTYVGRVFVLYRALANQQAEVVTLVDVEDFSASPDEGSTMVLWNRKKEQRLVVGHTPVRLFQYSAFVFLPTKQVLKWVATIDKPNAKPTFRLDFGTVITQRNHPRFHNRGNIYVCTPSDYLERFGVNVLSP